MHSSGDGSRRGGLLILVVSAFFLVAVAVQAEPGAPSRIELAQATPPSWWPAERPPWQAPARRSLEEICPFPWSYSQGLRRCVCVRPGYSLQRGVCGPVAAQACGENERWSRKYGACICAKGMKREGGVCIPREEDDGVQAADGTEEPEGSKAIKRAQRCLAELGYYEGPIEGAMSRPAWTAYWNFKHDNGLGAYSDPAAAPVQEKMRELCKQMEQGEETAGPPPDEEENVEFELERRDAEIAALSPREETVGPPSESLAGDCLPEDLIALLRTAHESSTVIAPACEASCLPMPKGMSETDLADFETGSGIGWCEACVPLDGYLSLEDVSRIERAAKVQLCPTPPKRMPRLTGAAAEAGKHMRIRSLYRSLAPAAEDDDVVAVIIGNRTYASLPASSTAHNDAGAIYAFLTEHLGYRQENVLDIRDAKKADLESLFGTATDAKGELWRRLRDRPGARVVVYYSGLGGSNADQTETYLLPVDAERYREERSGYPLSQLYANLDQLGAQSVLVLLEAEFGRDHGPYIFPPNAPERTASPLPQAPLSSVTVFAASDRGQRTLADPTYGTGLFTRYLIEGWADAADRGPVGNGDGKIDSVEIYVYAAHMVRLAARKSFGLLQNPLYSGSRTIVLSSEGPGQD